MSEKRRKFDQDFKDGAACIVLESGRPVAEIAPDFVYRILLATKACARRQLIRWFDRYNQTRRHSHCHWRTPIAYEKITTQTRGAA